MVMVKTGARLPRTSSRASGRRSTSPVAAYHVSGEYAMLKASGPPNGWIDGDAVALEHLARDPGAPARDFVLTYLAREGGRAPELLSDELFQPRPSPASRVA